MRSTGVSLYEDAYDATGIRTDSHPSPRLIDLAARAHVLAASDMVRAVESARRLVPDRTPIVVPELRELRLEPPHWLPLRLPIEAWDAMSYFQWNSRMRNRTDHEIMHRAGAAAAWLLQQARPDTVVVAVTHGGIRRLIDFCLAEQGWRTTPGRRSHANWSCWSYQSG